jgi:hypothetical protein
MSRVRPAPWPLLALAGLSWGLAGCGARTYPVHGVVAWPDGTPATELAGYAVTFESLEAKVGASGDVQKDGTFRVGTYKDNDGAVPGKHRVALTPPDPLHDVDKPRPRATLPPHYRSLDTSGLVVTVERKTNEVTLRVERGKP